MVTARLWNTKQTLKKLHGRKHLDLWVEEEELFPSSEKKKRNKESLATCKTVELAFRALSQRHRRATMRSPRQRSAVTNPAITLPLAAT